MVYNYQGPDTLRTLMDTREYTAEIKPIQPLRGTWTYCRPYHVYLHVQRIDYSRHDSGHRILIANIHCPERFQRKGNFWRLCRKIHEAWPLPIHLENPREGWKNHLLASGKALPGLFNREFEIQLNPEAYLS